MTHRAAQIVRSWLHSDTDAAAQSLQLQTAQPSQLLADLKADAEGIYYSVLVSFCDAASGIESGYFSWATVKLYYLCFYCARIILAVNGVAIFYVTNGRQTGRPYSIKAQLGASGHREHGVTHEMVWRIFEREFPNHPLLGQIGPEQSHQWMKRLREDVNYRIPKFADPMVPSHFSIVDKLSPPKAALIYLQDTTTLYAFDPDHAAFAFPIECIKHAALALRRVGIAFGIDDEKFLHQTMQKIRLEEEFSVGVLI